MHHLPPHAHDPFVPAVEIFVDGPNFNLAQRYEGVPFRIDLNLLANRLSSG